MKLALKILGILLAVLILIVAGAYLHLNMTWKKSYADMAKPAIAASADSATIARGEYLVHAVVHCSACHQTGAEMKNRAGTKLNLELAGGHVWDLPLFGRFVAANITPDEETGIGKLSDGDIARAVRNGVNRQGYLAPFMAFAVGPMADEDLTAVISYVRSLKPVKNAVGMEAYGLFGKLVAKGIDPATREAAPKWVKEGGVSVERGHYLANGPALCFGCHTDADPFQGLKLVGQRFAGTSHGDPDGIDPAYEIAAPNLTPDPETGHIVKWAESDFITRFRAGVVYPGSPMPWENFARMTDDDLKSIYAYLKTLAPVKHDVGPTRRAKGSFKPAKA